MNGRRPARSRKAVGDTEAPIRLAGYHRGWHCVCHFHQQTLQRAWRGPWEQLRCQVGRSALERVGRRVLPGWDGAWWANGSSPGGVSPDGGRDESPWCVLPSCSETLGECKGLTSLSLFTAISWRLL